MAKKTTPLYEQVQDYIMNIIQSGELKPGDGLPSEFKLAEIMKVNRLTLRKAYKILCEKNILYSIQGKGTFIVDDLNVSAFDKAFHEKFPLKKRVLGVIFPEISQFFTAILKEIEQLSTQNNYTLNIMFNDSAEREFNAVNNMISNKVDGIFICPLRNNNSYGIENYKKLISSGIPLVMVGKPPFGIQCDCIMCDDVTATYDAIKCLVDKGSDNLLYIYNSLADKEALIERTDGVNNAVKEFIEKENYFSVDAFDHDWLQTTLKTIEENNISLIFTDSEYIIIQLYNSIISNENLSSKKIAYICYNNTDVLDQFSIPVHTIQIPKVDMGNTAFNLLNNSLIKPNSEKPYSTYSIFTPALRMFEEKNEKTL